MRVPLLGDVSLQMRVPPLEVVCLTQSLGHLLTAEAKRQPLWRKLGADILELEGSKEMMPVLIPNYSGESRCRSTMLYYTVDVNSCIKRKSYICETRLTAAQN